jgi:integrase
MAKKLTEKGVQRLAIKRQTYWEYDNGARGLCLKVTPEGQKIWVMRTVYPGQMTQARRTLGKYPGLGVANARAKAEQWYAWVKDGIDPKDREEEEREQREAERLAQAEKRANTVASYAKKYIADRASNRRAAVDAQEIMRTIVRRWGTRPIGSITPADVRSLIEQLRTRPYEMRNCWSHVTGLFKSAVHDGLIEASPAASLSKKHLFRGTKLVPRQRVLNDREIAALWLASGALGYPYGQLYRLLLLTGARLNEVAKARWEEFDTEIRRRLREASGKPIEWSAIDPSKKRWVVPAARFKSGSDHIVPLTDDALRIIENLPRFPDCEWLFSVEGRLPPAGFGKVKGRLDKLMTEALRKQGDDPDQVKLADWVNHDLRRVVRSNLAALKVPDHVAEMCLGHGRKGLQRVYDQHEYFDEQRDALTQWAAKLRGIVGPEPTTPPAVNVVALRQVR